MSLPIDRSLLDGLVVFLAVAELRGFRAAARHLDITPSAVSQAVRVLEARIGVTLFARTTRSVGLTEAGERLLAQVRPAIGMLGDGIDALSGAAGEIGGLLRINSPRPMLAMLANRLLPEFLERHPKLRLELVGEDRLVDIVSGGFDAGIRPATMVQADMIAVPLTPAYRLAVVGSPALLRRLGRPRKPGDLLGLPCVRFRLPAGTIDDWQFSVDERRLKVAVDGPLIVNDVEMQIRSALRGVALVQLPRPLVLDYLRRGELISVLDRFAIEAPALALYYPARSRGMPKLRAFVEFARERMRGAFGPGDFAPTR